MSWGGVEYGAVSRGRRALRLTIEESGGSLVGQTPSIGDKEMRKMLLAAMVAATVGVAQAVTVSWNKEISLGAGAAFTASISIASSSTSLNSLVETSNTNGLADLVTLLKLSGTDASDLQVNVWRASNGWVVETDKAMAGTSQNLGKIPPGTGSTITLLLSGKVNADGNGMTFSAYYKENSSGAEGVTFTWNGDFSGKWDTLTLFPDATGDTSGVGVNVWVDSVYRDNAQLAALPEPTVLALLALGVAGLALRRRVA